MLSAQAILKHVRWAAVGVWFSKGASLVIFVVLTRLLPPQAIGAVSLVAAYLALLQLLGEIGMGEYLVQQQGRDPLQEYSVFWMQLALGLLVLAAVWLAAPLLAASLSTSVPGEALVRTMSLTVPLIAASRVADALMRKALAFKQLAYRNLLAALCGGAVAIVCALQGYGVWALVIKQLVESSVALVAVMIAAHWFPRCRFSAASLREPLAYGLSIFGTRALNIVHNRLDSLVVGWLLGDRALGYYSVALRMYQVVSELFNSVVDAVAVPILARAKHDAHELQVSFLRLVRGSSLLSMAAYAGLCGVAGLLIEVAFGPTWRSSADVLRWLAVVGWVTGPLWFMGAIMLATGRARSWLLVMAGYVLVGAVLFPAAAALGGILGVAMAQVCRTLLLAPVTVRVALQPVSIPYRPYIQAWLPNALVSTAVGLAGWLGAVAGRILQLPALASLALGVVSGVLAFLLVVPKLVPNVWNAVKQLLGLSQRSSP